MHHAEAKIKKRKTKRKKNVGQNQPAPNLFSARFHKGLETNQVPKSCNPEYTCQPRPCMICQSIRQTHSPDLLPYWLINEVPPHLSLILLLDVMENKERGGAGRLWPSLKRHSSVFA